MKFDDQVQISYHFQKEQPLKFVVADGGAGGGELGSVETTMTKLFINEHNAFTAPLQGLGGTLSVSCEEAKTHKEFLVKEKEKMVRFRFRWERLNNMNNGFFGLGKSRARVRFEVAKYDVQNKRYQKLKSTPFIKNEKENSTYRVPSQVFTFSQICDKKMNQKIKFGVFDTRDVEVNKVIVSVNELLEEAKFEGYDGSKLIFESFELYDRPNFLEYLSANW